MVLDSSFPPEPVRDCLYKFHSDDAVISKSSWACLCSLQVSNSEHHSALPCSPRSGRSFKPSGDRAISTFSSACHLTCACWCETDMASLHPCRVHTNGT